MVVIRKTILLLTFALLSMGLPGPSVAEAKTAKVLVIGIDGLRPDALETVIANGDAPNIAALIANGQFSNRATTSQLTFSGPGWSDILLGVHRDEHAVQTNSTCNHATHDAIYCNSNQPLYNDLLAHVKSFDSSLVTARYTTWQPMHTTRTPGGSDVAVFYHYGISVPGQGDDQIVIDLANYISTNDPDAIFLYQADVDVIGHGGHGGHGLGNGQFSPTSAAYLAEIAETDTNVGMVLNAIANRSTYNDEDWLIIVVTDHGGTGNGHGSNIDEHRYTPLIVSGDSVPLQHPSINPMFVQPKNVDVVTTALAHLGASPSYIQSLGLRGHILGQTQSVQPPIGNGLNLVFNGNCEYDRGFINHGYDQVISGWVDSAGTNGITALRYGAPGGFPLTTSPGPIKRGLNFFSSGSDNSPGSITQRIDLRGVSADIDGGGVTYDLSGFLGGYSSQSDHATFTVRFLDNGGSQISAETIGPVTAADRGNVTGLLLREKAGNVPVGTREVEFVLLAVGNDGYADNLRFMLAGLSAPSVIGEVGKLRVNQPDANTWHTVNLQRTYVNPVVVMGPPSIWGAQPVTIRVRNVTAASFQWQFDEWDYLDGEHTDEYVHYMVMEAGVHALPGGILVEAGTAHDVTEAWQSVGFSQSFVQPPIVLSQCMTRNESSPVVTRQRSVTTGGFEVLVQESEGDDNVHAGESVGYIAFLPGASNAGSIPFESDTTGTTVTHNFVTIGFLQSYSDQVVLAAMQSAEGLNTATLRRKNVSGISFDLKVEEEQSADAEVYHVPEDVGYIIFDRPGLLVADN